MQLYPGWSARDNYAQNKKKKRKRMEQKQQQQQHQQHHQHHQHHQQHQRQPQADDDGGTVVHTYSGSRLIIIKLKQRWYKNTRNFERFFF